MASPIVQLLNHINPPALRPLARYDVQKRQRGAVPLSNLQFNTAQRAILSGKPVFKHEPNHGILSDIVGLPGNLARDATQTAMGLFSPWKWIPSIYHSATTGNVDQLLPLIPGYTTTKNLVNGDFHAILTHPAGTTLDILPYAHGALPALGESIYGAKGAEAARVADLAENAVHAPGTYPVTTVPLSRVSGEVGEVHAPGTYPVTTVPKTMPTSEAMEAAQVAPHLLKRTILEDRPQIDALKEDIAQNGITNPIDILHRNGKNIVWDGLHRLTAAHELGLEEVPYRMVNEVGEEVAPRTTPKPIDYSRYDANNPPPERPIPQGRPKFELREGLTPRQTRIAEAMREGKPGRTLMQTLPETIMNPEEGIIGKRLTDLQLRQNTGRTQAQYNRDYQKVAFEKYAIPLQETFKDFDPAEREAFSNWWTNYNENTPNSWKDVAGNVHEVTPKMQEAFPKVLEIAKKLEKAADPLLQRIWRKGREYIYHEGSPVVEAQGDIAKADARLAEARQAAAEARAAWLKHQMEEITPKESKAAGIQVKSPSRVEPEPAPEHPLYSEQDSQAARTIVNGTYSAGQARPLYMAEDPELALGQHNAHPVKITFDGDKLDVVANNRKVYNVGEVTTDVNHATVNAIHEVRIPNEEIQLSPTAPEWMRDPHAGLKADLERAGFVGKKVGDETIYTRPGTKIPAEINPLNRKSVGLFRTEDKIAAEEARINRLEEEHRFAKPGKRPKIIERLNASKAKLAELQAERELLSRREMLVHNLSKPDNAGVHITPEDYDVLNIRRGGEVKPEKAYQKALSELDDAKKNVETVRAKFDKVFKNNAPATFYPRIQDAILQKIAQKFQENHPDFMEGVSTFDPELTRAAIEQHTSGASPVEAGMVTQGELTKITKEVESTWQQMADEGVSPMYMANVPEDRFASVLDPNLFRGGAVKDEPFAVLARTRDITPSGIKDPVVGLTAPAMSILRRDMLREYYSTYLAPMLKSESDLHGWLDEQMAQGEFKELKPGETPMSRRNAIKASRWSAFDRENIDPELAQFFPEGEKLYLPKEVYDTVKQQFSPGSQNRLESVSKANIHGMRVFRTAVMGLSAKHLAHITFGGMAMLLLRGGLEEVTPSIMRQAWEMAKNDVMPKELSAGVDFYSGRQVAAGILPEGERTTLASKVGSKVASGFAKVQTFEERIANFERSLSYLSELERIMSEKGTPHLTTIENAEVKAALANGDVEHAQELAKRGAIKHANKALIDFDGMLPAERGIVRNIFPFYAFTRQIFKYALSYPIDYPLRASFVYRLGEIVQKDMQDQGLPEQWMRYLTFGPDKEGNVTNVDLRFLNPFRSLPDDATGSGLVNTLNPFLGYAMEWAGVNPWTTSAERYPDITYNEQTGYTETKRKPFNLLGLVSSIIPQAGVFGNVVGAEPGPKGISNQISRYGFIPGLPHHGNVNLQRAIDTLGQYEVAQRVSSNALRTGNTSELKDWNLVPVPGQKQLVPGKLLARIIDSLPKNGKSPKQQLGLR